MKAFWTGVAALVLGLAMIGTSQAAGRSRPIIHAGYQRFTNYHLTYGKKFGHGFYYEGRFHKHWSSCYFDKRYGCYLYYDPGCSAYYYYCTPKACYYPVSYCPYQCYSWNEPAHFQIATAPAAIAPAPMITVAP